jgi:hypothetical protein
MRSFLERYEGGEHEPVWTELVALGDAVREEPLYTDALAVAHATMRRARRNIELLIPRLVAIGYQFGYGWVQPYVRERLVHPYRVAYSGRYGELVEPSIPDRFAYGQRLAYQEYLELAQSMPPLFVPADDREEQLAQLEATSATTAPSQEAFREQLRAMQAELQTKPSAQDRVAELEALLGMLPLSVRAWYEDAGGVNFVGDHPGWRALLPESNTDAPTNPGDYLNPMHVLNPLFVFPMDETRLAHYRTWAKPQPTGSHLTLADDEYGKYLDGTKYFYDIRVPTAAMDATFVYHGQTFIGYLRDCFRWGGFPGWAKLEQRPKEDLAFLTRELLPL